MEKHSPSLEDDENNTTTELCASVIAMCHSPGVVENPLCVYWTSKRRIGPIQGRQMQGSPACLRSVASGPVPVQNSIPRNSIPGVVSARRPEDAAPPSWRRPGACSDGATRPAVAIPDDGIERRLNHIGAAMKPPVGFLLQAAARPGRRRPHQTPARLRSRFSASQRKGKQPLQW